MKYRFNDPFAYKKNLSRNGLIFVVAWHMGLYSVYKYKVDKLSDEDREKFETLGICKCSSTLYLTLMYLCSCWNGEEMSTCRTLVFQSCPLAEHWYFKVVTAVGIATCGHHFFATTSTFSNNLQGE